MKAQEKIRFMRERKKWSQAEMATKLGMSTNGYSKIERGETKATMPKMEKIANALEINLMELLSFGEKNVAYLVADNNSNNNSISQTENASTKLTFEIQKLQLIIEHQKAIIQQKDQEIALLKQQTQDFREILLKL